MGWKQKIERSLNRYAVRHLTLLLICGQTLMFVLHLSRPQIVEGLFLIASQILAGQWWRLVTFMLLPPTFSPIWLFFDLYFFYLLGSALERQWGDLRYNLFLLIGYVATVAAAFIVPYSIATNMFLMASVFLAFAWLYPEFQVYLFMVLPIRVKYIAWVIWAYYCMTLITGDWMIRAMILASILNFLLFFYPEIIRHVRYGHKRLAAKAAAPLRDGAFHRCTVCGITDRTDPHMDFRYCPDCTGSLGYCKEHIHHHEHRRIEKTKEEQFLGSKK